MAAVPVSTMRRAFRLLLVLDAVALGLPTRALGPRLELALALGLLVLTALCWWRVELEGEGP